MCFFSMMSSPSFRWVTLLFDTVEALLIPWKNCATCDSLFRVPDSFSLTVSCATCDSLLYVLRAIGLEITKCRFESNQIDNDGILCSIAFSASSNWCFLLYSDCLGRQVLHGNTDVQRLPWFPLILSAILLCLLLRLCSGGSKIDTRHSLDLCDLVNQLYDTSIRTSLLMGNPSALLFSLLYGAPVQSITGSNTLVVFTLFQLNSSCAIDCEHLGRRINRIN